MEKTIEIDGRQVTFKSSGALPKRYKMQFGRDYFSDMLSMKNLSDGAADEEVDLQGVDFDMFYDLAWTLAKTADSSIPDPVAWLDEFEVFPIAEILPQIQELITASISSNNVKKK